MIKVTQSKFHFFNFSVFIGDNVKGKDVIVVDDMIHTGTKLHQCVNTMKKLESGKIFAYITHNLLTPQSFRKIEKLSIEELVSTNSISNVIT